jgi:aminopeptidase N
MIRLLLGALTAFMVISACSRDNYDPAHDYFSHANYDQFVTRHLKLDLGVDFERKTLGGNAVLHMKRLDSRADTIVLDSRGLQIRYIRISVNGLEGKAVVFDVGESDPVRGEAIRIQLPATVRHEPEFLVDIGYQTGPDASALMWLPPELTAGGKHPFMFTQSQSIHARSWVPLQDTPAVRITFEATIHTPPDLLALMSANNEPLTQRSGEYHFAMPQPIPSYLLALAVGNVWFQSVGEETGVYAEPEMLQAAAWEFADTQSMLEAAEGLYGPYQWGRYDLLILPPSFPYGGMENPRLSFITPSLLAGDRSLVSTIAHELAHSWSGNLVSNATWRDIWLNEGITSYLDTRLMEVLYGKGRADEEQMLGYQELLGKLGSVPADLQALAPVLQFGDPDIGQDGVEYWKGQLLLHTLEAKFGREIFDGYLSAYFEHFRFQAISSEQFLDFIDSRLLKKYPERYSRSQIEQWLYQPGIPDDASIPVSNSLENAVAIAAQWSSGERDLSEVPINTWSPQGMVAFINALPAGLSDNQLNELDLSLGLSATGNAEIARAWFIQVASRKYRPAYNDMSAYLARFGRIRLIKPVYDALISNGEDRTLARAIFEKTRAVYHPLTIAAISSLSWEPDQQ